MTLRKAEELSFIAKLVACSPFRNRPVVGGMADLASLLETTKSPRDLVSQSRFKHTRKTLSHLTGDAADLRRTAAFVGNFSMPPPAEIKRLLTRGMGDIQFTGRSKLHQELIDSLWILLVHPLNDGNGRLFRLAVVLTFLNNSRSAYHASQFLGLLFKNNARDFYDAVQIAAGGDFQPYYELVDFVISQLPTAQPHQQ